MSAPRVVVVGGGVAGASCAWSLARRGVQVGVIDAADRGQATAAGAGIIEPWSAAVDDAEPFGQLYRAAAEHYGPMLDQLGAVGVTADDVGYRASGMLVVGTDTGQLEEVLARCERRRAAAGGATRMGRVELLNSAQVRRLFPPLAPDLSAVCVSGGARVDGRRLRDGLLRAAQARGATVQSGRVALTRSPAGRPRLALAAGSAGPAEAGGGGVGLDAETVVLAAGAWTDQLLAPLGHATGVEPQRGQLVHLRLEGLETAGWPAVHAADRSGYLVCFGSGRIVAGATRETGSGFVASATAGGVHDVLATALRMAPGLAAAQLQEIRVGLRPLPADGRPRIGWLEDGLALCCGLGAGGLTIGPYAGELLAAAILS